jgi:hypothetical protein
MRVAKTATMTTIGEKDVAAIEIPIPPRVLQKEFAERVVELRVLDAAQVGSRGASRIYSNQCCIGRSVGSCSSALCRCETIGTCAHPTKYR